MRRFLAVCLLLAVATAFTVDKDEIVFENPPTEAENEGEWCLVPDSDGELQLVNTLVALSQPVPHFSPRFGVRFELFTLRNIDQPQLLNALDLDALHSSDFNPNRPTRFVTHGWRAGGWLTEMFVKAFLVDGQHDVNLFIVDWGAGANTFNYINAVRRVESVGQYMAQFIDFLAVNAGLNVKTTHLIGHSLGAHVSGFAGKHLRTGKLAKIVALDPAAPLFDRNNPATRVASGDADHVDVIITNGGTLGIQHPIGDANYYPNGGRTQPGCGRDLRGSCAHSRAYLFLTESITSDVGFRTYQCNSFEEMTRGRCRNQVASIHMGGEPGNMGAARGVFYVPTNNQSPFILSNPI